VQRLDATASFFLFRVDHRAIESHLRIEAEQRPTSSLKAF
jgi:hypothetical protein